VTRKVNKHRTGTVQSTGDHFFSFPRKSDRRGSVGKFFLVLDDGEGDVDDLDGSGRFRVPYYYYYYLNPLHEGPLKGMGSSVGMQPYMGGWVSTLGCTSS